MKNLDNKIQILNENRGEVSLYEYVTAESQSDPNFFRFLFSEEFEQDFDSSLSVDQKSEFENWVLQLRKEFLLENWIVVSFPYADHDNTIRVTRRANFEQMNFCDAYGDYGQQVSCYDAGCYSFENSASSIFDDFYTAISDRYGIGSLMDDINAGNFTVNDLVDLLKESNLDLGVEYFGKDFHKMIKFFEAWKAKNENHTEVTGWTYWDSHNHKTVVSKCDFGEPDCIELDEEEQIEILLQMPETTPYINGTNASEETEDFFFHFDRWATNPWFCYVEKK